MSKQNKLILPVAIIIGCMILGGFYYASQVNKQQSIEKQQLINLQNEKQIRDVKAEKEKREYVSKRRMECYEIEQKERKNWNNVVNSYYQEAKDGCIINYKTSEYDNYTIEDCRKEFGAGSLAVDCYLHQTSRSF